MCVDDKHIDTLAVRMVGTKLVHTQFDILTRYSKNDYTHCCGLGHWRQKQNAVFSTCLRKTE
jgi:hypothetical protein